jgi:nitrogen fixation/metabolism regulation signal transduction histidine kinase
MVFAVLLPAVPAARMARQLITRSLNLGLSPQIDTALKSGVIQARGQYQRQCQDLADSLGVWVAEAARRTGTADAVMRAGAANGVRGASGGVIRAKATNGARAALDGLVRPTAEDVLRAAAGPAGARLPGTEAVLQLPDGTQRVLRPGAADTATAPISKHAPPRTADATQTLADGSVLTVRCPTSAAWRTDAQAILGALQIVRGLQLVRAELERAFWLPFLGLYALSVVAALVVAGFLARGFLVPVRRLVLATQEVGAGNWNVRVPVKGRDEINRLGAQFNDMLERLNAQSRTLSELEEIARWRVTARAMVHEVRNPLAPMKSTVEELSLSYAGEDRVFAGLLDRSSRALIEQLESLEKVVKRFQEFSRPVEPIFARMDLNALVADVGALLHDLRVELDLAPGLETIRADVHQLRQVLMNLVHNARTAMDKRESPCLRLATRAAGDHVVVEVEDNGPGIPAADRDRVFEPFRTKTAGGLGLGLALVKGIVLAHGGSVRAEEGRLGGACIRVELPRNPEA